MPNAKVLIIEDDKFLSAILKGRLEKEAYTVFQAFDGEEGLNMMRETKPDLVILDLIMPKVSGFEFLESVSADPLLNQIPIVVISNLGQESDIEKAKNLGVMEYYVKARVSIDELNQIIKNFITEKLHLE